MDQYGDGLVQRQVLKETAPQHVEYELTALDKTLQEPLAAICAWAAEHSPALPAWPSLPPSAG